MMETDQALAEAQKFRNQIESVKKVMRELKEESNLSFSDIAQGIRNINDVTGQFQPRAITQALQEVRKESGETTSSLGKLGSVAQYVFGAVLGLSVLGIIRQFIGLLQDATQSAIEFTQSQFRLEVAVRGLQRAGLDTTLKTWRDEISEIKRQFPIFSRKDITEAVAQAALMTREFGFTEDQIQKIIQSGIVLAEITGKSLTDAIRNVTVAIGSGYTEALQRMGLNISRGTLQQAALSRGYTESWQALDPLIRAQITYESILDGVADVQDDAGKITETWAGKQIAATAAIEDQKLEIGETLAPLKLLVQQIELLALKLFNLTSGLTFFGRILQTVSVSLGTFVDTLRALFPNFDRTIDRMQTRTGEFIDFWKQKLEEGTRAYNEFLNNIARRSTLLAKLVEIAKGYVSELAGIWDLGGVQDILGDTAIGTGERVPTELENLDQITRDLYEKINDEVERGERRRLEIQEDFDNDIIDLWVKHYQKLADLNTQYQQKLSDISLREQQRIADENSRYAQDIQDENRKAAEKRADAERKYRDKELEEEARFQEKLRSLREDFLLDLEDAVRERDARQIIRLTRNYNKERGQLIRQNDLRKKEREDAFRDELLDIERQRQIRIQQLSIDHQRRLQQISINAQRERAQAEVEYQRDQQELELALQRQLDARTKKFGEELEQNQRATQQRINDIAKGLLEEYNVTEDMLGRIAELYEAYYGPNGYLVSLINNYVEYLNEVAKIQNQILNAQGITNRKPKNPSLIPDEKAEGGTIIANEPTTVTFGEAGWEAATFTPLNRSGVNVGQTTGAMPAGIGRSNQEGLLRVLIGLSPGLEGEFIDKSLDALAGVYAEINRARK